MTARLERSTAMRSPEKLARAHHTRLKAPCAFFCTHQTNRMCSLLSHMLFMLFCLSTQGVTTAQRACAGARLPAPLSLRLRGGDVLVNPAHARRLAHKDAKLREKNRGRWLTDEERKKQVCVGVGGCGGSAPFFPATTPSPHQVLLNDKYARPCRA